MITDGSAAMTEDLLWECTDGIGRLTFNRPAQRNALTWAMYDGLVATIDRVDADPAMRALILTGAGDKAFAAGTDIAQFRDVKSPADALAYEHRIDQVLTRLETCRIPTIAAIAGACTGGGAAIAACCDLRLAATGARFGFPIAKTLGNCLSMANLARLSALIGAARVKEIIFTARLLDAEEAHRIGLISEITTQDALPDRAQALARTVAALAPLTLRSTKLALRRLQTTVTEDEDLILMCYQSADFREGMEAFLAKRSPAWTGT